MPRELWGWQEGNFLQRNSRSVGMSNCLWDEVNNNDDDLLYMLGEHTPVKDCADFDYLISDNGDKGKDGVEESVESSQQKRRRMLQFNSDDVDSISMELSSAFIKSKIGDSFMEEGVNNENMQWVSGFLG
ncbi:hypothetical protein Taro_038950 [Colocasia esculenta]|uniref:Uncharacterized protein n=1 Tax=Colocasia esculenta TaxID=4460 RepID=A0A843WU78_COLES|nr:hypothetical protein [Colocasia esculenta]